MSFLGSCLGVVSRSSLDAKHVLFKELQWVIISLFDA
jgi:hypothetical protein